MGLIALVSPAEIPVGRRCQLLRVTSLPLRMLLPRVRRARPEEGSNVVAGEDADPAGDEGHAPQPAVLLLPEDTDPFPLLQLQLLGAMGCVGVQRHAPGEKRGERGQEHGWGTSCTSWLSCAENWCCWLGAAPCLQPLPPAANVWVLQLLCSRERLPVTPCQRGCE